MNPGGKKAAGLALIVVLVVLLVLSIVKNVSLATRLKQIKAENSQLSQQVSQLTLTIEEKDKKIEADRDLYTSLAGRLHKEMKRVAELEEQLKEIKRK